MVEARSVNVKNTTTTTTTTIAQYPSPPEPSLLQFSQNATRILLTSAPILIRFHLRATFASPDFKYWITRTLVHTVDSAPDTYVFRGNLCGAPLSPSYHGINSVNNSTVPRSRRLGHVILTSSATFLPWSPLIPRNITFTLTAFPIVAPDN